MIQNLLERLYSNVELSNSSFTGINNLYTEARKVNPDITIKDVKNFLKTKKSYTLHRLTRKRFTRRSVTVAKPKVIIGSDLADMRNLSRQNGGVKYLLVIIDMFSRFACVEGLKKKTGQAVAEKLETIFERNDFNGVVRMNTDEGKEYYNTTVKEYLKNSNIELYSVSSREIKVSIAERFIRTLKSRLYKYMTHNNTLEYISVLPKIVENYNDTRHRTLGTTPRKVHFTTDRNMIKHYFNRIHKIDLSRKKVVSNDLTVGDAVRIADETRNKFFARGYKIQNTLEIFRIREVNSNFDPKVYHLEDLEGEPIIGSFYREELIPTVIPTHFDIEIIRKKKVGGKSKYLVHWVGYPEKYNSWIDEEEIIMNQ